MRKQAVRQQLFHKPQVATVVSSHNNNDNESLNATDDVSRYLSILAHHHSIFSPFLMSSSETGGWSVIILDGGNATEIERLLSTNFTSDLWSALAVTTIEGREAIKKMHLQYLDAGADIITTVSYQASVAGFQRVLSITAAEAEEWMRLIIKLAVEARDSWWNNHQHHRLRCKPLVAASIGCYGAYLAGGQEYTGDYGSVPKEEIEEFQRERIKLISNIPGIDLILLETMPNIIEIISILNTTIPSLLSTNSSSAADQINHLPPICISLSCSDQSHLRDGTEIVTVINHILHHNYSQQLQKAKYQRKSLSTAHDQKVRDDKITAEDQLQSHDSIDTDDAGIVIGIGVNCCHPKLIEGLMSNTRNALIQYWKKIVDPSNHPSLPLLMAYPNSGEEYDPITNSFFPLDDDVDQEVETIPSFSALVTSWHAAGAHIIGGCCRTGPDYIRRIRAILLSQEQEAERTPVMYLSPL